ncbi:MAG: hypothetical protein REH83_00945 [Rickettsiella sp.]|nr:hypothetical protein [Rickettsiella sp.]
MPINKKISVENWNKNVLPTEERILTILPEVAFQNGTISKLFDEYKQGINKEISLYEKDEKLIKILDKRLSIIERYIVLKKHVACEPMNTENNAEDRIKDISSLTQKLAEHCQYIRENHTLLEEKNASEKHLPPIIFNLLADAFDYLATLQWNLLDSKPKNEVCKTIFDVIRSYKACIYCLHEEKKLLPKSYANQCDKKINAAIQLVIDTFDEVTKLKDELELSKEFYNKLMNFKESAINFLRKPPEGSIAHLFAYTKQPQTPKRKSSESTRVSEFFKNKKTKESVNETTNSQDQINIFKIK